MPNFLKQVTARENRFALGISLLAALGGFLFGYDTGVVGGALPLITAKLSLNSNQESWITGSLLLGAVTGAFISGGLADLIGRRWTVFIAGVIYVIAAIVSGLAPTFFFLAVARGVLGLAVGTASFVAPMYISEHSPKALRGGMTAFTQLAICFGIFIAYLIDDLFKNVTGGWRWMFGLGAAPGLILAVSMLFVPETPRWLVEHGHSDKAKRFLIRSRGEEAAAEELQEIHETTRAEERFHPRQLLRVPIRPLLVIGVTMAIVQQVIGINTVIYYGATILGFAGLSINSSIAQAVFIGIVNLLGAGIAVILLDKVGRRPPLITGTIGSIIGLIVLGLYFNASGHFQHAHAWIALVAMMFYIFSFEISLGPIFWVMIAEIFPLRARAKAMAICTMFNWAFNFFVSFFFLDAVNALGRPGTFWMYAAFGVVAVVFFWKQVPETKNRSLEQIERDVIGHSAEGAAASDGSAEPHGDGRPGGARSPHPAAH